MSIIPAKNSGRIVDYFCTWEHQGHFSAGRRSSDLITEASMFAGDHPWCELFPEIREELFFVMDDGWDVPPGSPAVKDYTALQPHPEKFPSLTGSPTERLRQLDEKVRRAGWYGLGLWIATNAYKNGELAEYNAPDPEVENRWRERILFSREAGIRYWKADWGNECSSIPFRRMMTEIGHLYHPDLIIEHGRGHAPYNGRAKPGNCRAREDETFFPMMTGFSRYSDALRTYDVAWLENATTLDRIETYSRTATGILNCEHLAYMGAVLGCSIGIMQSPLFSDAGLEPVAAVRWHRTAPPFAGGETHASEKLLTEHTFLANPTWYYEDAPRDLVQQAPAVVSRGTGLPEVRNGCEEWIPFIAASLNPNGAYSVGSFKRQSDGAGTVLPDVVCRPEQLAERIGVFGNFSRLEFDFRHTGRRISRVLAQGLIRGEAEDVTDACVDSDGRVVVGRELIERIFHTEDRSAPAVMLALTF
ncbi:MAG: hypothetical protein IK132_11800 [Clostridia bacterium]|nr:hypothetical protein [Clostridia bacterium]